MESGRFFPTARVCRLCATTRGPFHNLFSEDFQLVDKLTQLMSIEITECDDLPHKVCFLCMAKVIDLHNFVKKCSKIQDYLYAMVGKQSLNRTPTQLNKPMTEINTSNSGDEMIIDINLDGYERFDESASVNSTLNNEISVDDNSHAENIRLKDLKVVLSKINDSNNQIEPTQCNGSPKKSNAKRFSSFYVTNYGEVFKCNNCLHVMSEKSDIESHICQFERNPSSRRSHFKSLQLSENKLRITKVKISKVASQQKKALKEVVVVNKKNSGKQQDIVNPTETDVKLHNLVLLKFSEKSIISHLNCMKQNLHKKYGYSDIKLENFT